MSFERISDHEFENVLRVASPRDLPSGAAALITELFHRVKALEAPIANDRVALLTEIAEGMEEELDLLGNSPDKIVLRDRMRAVIKAVGDLAKHLDSTTANR